MYIFCSADRTKPGAIFFAYISLETAPDHFIMLKLNKLENQTIRPAAEVYDVCAQLCSLRMKKILLCLSALTATGAAAFAWAALYKRTKWDWR